MRPLVAKLAALRAARLLNGGALLAHHTATLPGVVVSPGSPSAVARLIRYKQRQGPFLLLADSLATALSLSRNCTPALRKKARASWPGPVTLVFPARPGLPPACYRRGRVAVRVDASPQVRSLAKACGGLLISSSLNRRGGSTADPDRRLSMRLHRHLAGVVPGAAGSGRASTLLRLGRNDFTVIRP